MPPTHDDNDAWQQEIASVKPLKHKTPTGPKIKTDEQTEKAPAAHHAQAAEAKTKMPNMPSSNAPAKRILPITIGNSAGVDNATLRKLKRGQTPIHRTLDLHGMRQADALEALEYFITEHAGGVRKLLLVITGKGGIDTPGILKTNMPQWLNLPTIRPYILYADYAGKQHGGSGAFYVLLRKNPL